MGSLQRIGTGLILLAGTACADAAWADRGGEPLVRVLVLESTDAVRIRPAGGASHTVRPAVGRSALGLDGRTVRGPHRFAGGGKVRVQGKPYRGSIEVYRLGEAIAVVNEVPLEDYVAGTLHRELYPSWDGEALRAQAVATRTYALHRMARSDHPAHHLGASARDQVYGGIDAETPTAVRAARDTQGEFLAFEGEPILAVFHSASGGRTASAEEVWGQSIPYLVSVKVEGEELSPDTYWRVTVPAPTLLAGLGELGDRLGPLRELRVVERTQSGRVRLLFAQGARGSAEISGRRLRQGLGLSTLRSTLYEVRRDGSDFIFVGSGYGHGVGMSQWGARAMAQRGMSYREILRRFYPGTLLRRLEEEDPAVAARGAVQ